MVDVGSNWSTTILITDPSNFLEAFVKRRLIVIANAHHVVSLALHSHRILDVADDSRRQHELIDAIFKERKFL